MALRIFELSLLFGGALVIITQLLIPALRGTQSFPLFRKERQLLSHLEEVRQENREHDIAQTIAKEKGQQ